MRGEVFTDQNLYTNKKYEHKEQGLASDEEINCIRDLCFEKGLVLPNFDAFIFWALPNKDYTQEQFLNDYDALRNLSIDTKWPYGYTISDSVKEKYWKGSMYDTFTITTNMVLRYVQGFYMNPSNRYAVKLAFSIQSYKHPRVSSSELDVSTVVQEYNEKNKGELIEMFQDNKIHLAYGPVQWVERF